MARKILIACTWVGLPRTPRDTTVEPSATQMHGMYYDGDDYAYIDFKDNILLDNHFTVELWVRFTEIRVSQRYSFFQKVEYFGHDHPFFEFYFDVDGGFKVAMNDTEVLVLRDAYDGDIFVGNPDDDPYRDSDDGGWIFIGVSLSGVYYPTLLEDKDGASFWNKHPSW